MQSFHSIHQALSSQLILGHVCCALSWVGVLWLPLVREMDICRHNRDDIPAFLCSQTSRLSTCCNALCLTLFTPGVIGEGCPRALLQYPGSNPLNPPLSKGDSRELLELRDTPHPEASLRPSPRHPPEADCPSAHHWGLVPGRDESRPYRIAD